MTTVAKKSAADTVKQKKSGVLGRLWRAHKLDPQEQSVGHGDEEEQHGASIQRLRADSVAAWPRTTDPLLAAGLIDHECHENPERRKFSVAHTFNREDSTTIYWYHYRYKHQTPHAGLHGTSLYGSRLLGCSLPG